MEWTGLNELREKFLHFFEEKGHLRLPSAPLVPQDDQSLLLINSGMAPLKKYFLGVATPPSKRVTTCQKCIRTPDIEQVGKTSRHGTFFEMLGNFSFGDYFKLDATLWAWEFLTQELEIPKELLYVSVYEKDDEAYDIWTKQRGIDPSHMVRLGKDDNFWEIGSGPCGPCSELYFDRGPEKGCGSPDCAVGCECDRFIEIWNLVFTQFNSDGQGNYTPLEHPNIDTGMGLERLAVVMQGVDNLFEVDTVQKIMSYVANIAGVTYGESTRTDVSLRVITDHIRSTVFLVSDGVTPNNTGRGYVLRRLLRRAARYGKLLGITDPFLCQVADVVIQENASAYPELVERADLIRKVILAEEESFSRTIEKGMNLLSDLLDRVEASGLPVSQKISGEDAFRLYDTFGFPIDLTKEIAAEHGFQVDEELFRKLMKRQQEAAQEDAHSKNAISWEQDALANSDVNDNFIGYSKLDANTKILAVLVDGELVDEAREGTDAAIVLEDTPFYAESGGQVGDTGIISVGKSLFKVTDCTKSPTGHFVHTGTVVSGFMSVGDTAFVAIDKKRRRDIMRNHTATHLLQAALQKVLGDHVHQAGSYVDNHICRFDFTHFSAVSPQELLAVEQQVNDWILSDLPVSISEMSMDEARKLGAMALFGDKYGDTVRVVQVQGASIELCGGTHAGNSGELGLFQILSESSVASGVRRIEGTTGYGVLSLLQHQKETILQTCQELKVASVSELVPRSHAIMGRLSTQEKEIEQLERQLAAQKTASLEDTMQEIGALRFVTLLADGPMDALQEKADQLKEKYPNIVGSFVTQNEGKTSLLVFAGKEAVAHGIPANLAIKEITSVVGGSGGGRPDRAMGGINDTAQLAQAWEKLTKWIQENQK